MLKYFFLCLTFQNGEIMLKVRNLWDGERLPADDSGASPIRQGEDSMGSVSFCRHCGKPVNQDAAICLSCGCPPATGKAFCGNCGNAVKPEQTVCLSCGAAVAAGGGSNNEPIRNNGKSASTATILSCLVIGLGQMYLGQIMKGVAILLGGFVLSTVTYGILGLPIWIAAMIDAYKIGKRLENGETVGQWQFF